MFVVAIFFKIYILYSMNTKQQKETKAHFSRDARRWAKAAKGKYFVNTIKQRNDYVLSVIKRVKARSLLDVGCGTGDLVCEAAKRGISALGIDFAPGMIEVSQKLKKRRAIRNADFILGDVFTMDFSEKHFNIISANGFIEYISLNQLEVFFGLVAQLLPKGGSFVFGSRNRLFNIVSFNTYTKEELDGGEMSLLLEEGLFIANQGVKGIEKIRTASLPEEGKSYARTSNIKVKTRYQFTPAQLTRMLIRNGFDVCDVSPIHIHPAGLFLKETYPKQHTELSDTLQLFAESNTKLLPFASSFMVHAVKK